MIEADNDVTLEASTRTLRPKRWETSSLREITRRTVLVDTLMKRATSSTESRPSRGSSVRAGSSSKTREASAMRPVVYYGHPTADAHEREQLGRMPLGVRLPVGLRAIGRGEDGLESAASYRRPAA